MKALAIVVLLAAATEARAQGGVPISFGPLPEIIGGVIDGSLVGLGLTSGVFGGAGLVRGEPKLGWLILSGISGALETAVGVGMLVSTMGGSNPGAGWRAFGAGHLAMGLINLALPVLGIAQAVISPVKGSLGVMPMALHGVGPGGRRWSGVGVEVKL